MTTNKEVGMKLIEGISFWLAAARAPSFYFERDYTEEDARKAFEDANFVYEAIKSGLKIMERGEVR